MGRTLKYQLKKKRSLIASKRIRRRWRANRTRPRSWSLASARCVGSSHLQSDTPCQDWASTSTFDNGDVAIALADGAGSAKFSHYGSSLVVRRISKLISEHFDEAFGGAQEKTLFKKRLISQLQIDLNELAKLGIDLPDSERDRHDAPSRSKLLLVPCDMADLACTALCVVVRGNRYIAVHVGDGVIGAEVSRRGKISLEILSMPDNGEFANETYFVTSRKALESSRLITGRIDNGRKQITGFILMSDGPEASLYNKRESSLAPACSKLLAACRKMSEDDMCAQLENTLKNVIAKKTSDDCSLALMALDD